MINQISKTLPASDWQKVVIEEKDQPLVEIKETEFLKVGLIKKSYESSFFVRKTVAEKLYEVSKRLPVGIKLILIEGWRSIQSQQESWDSKFNKLKSENPHWSEEEIEKQVRLVVAKPSPLANHHCGGAVDVTLAYDDGTFVDMGSPYPSVALSAEWYKKFKMLSDEITEEQKNNRKILRDAMETEGFVWYPGEWWHYCFGDRMWAVYSNQEKCFYGPIEL
jgi:D-alanyl-D-alanine dipeptidase